MIFFLEREKGIVYVNTLMNPFLIFLNFMNFFCKMSLMPELFIFLNFFARETSLGYSLSQHLDPKKWFDQSSEASADICDFSISSEERCRSFVVVCTWWRFYEVLQAMELEGDFLREESCSMGPWVLTLFKPTLESDDEDRRRLSWSGWLCWKNADRKARTSYHLEDWLMDLTCEKMM